MRRECKIVGGVPAFIRHLEVGSALENLGKNGEGYLGLRVKVRVRVRVRVREFTSKQKTGGNKTTAGK